MVALQRYVDRHGTPPTRREMAELLGYASPSQANRMIDQLCARGYLDRLPRRSHALTILVRV